MNYIFAFLALSSTICLCSARSARSVEYPVEQSYGEPVQDYTPEQPQTPAPCNPVFDEKKALETLQVFFAKSSTQKAIDDLIIARFDELKKKLPAVVESEVKAITVRITPGIVEQSVKQSFENEKTKLQSSVTTTANQVLTKYLNENLPSSAKSQIDIFFRDRGNALIVENANKEVTRYVSTVVQGAVEKAVKDAIEKANINLLIKTEIDKNLNTIIRPAVISAITHVLKNCGLEAIVTAEINKVLTSNNIQTLLRNEINVILTANANTYVQNYIKNSLNSVVTAAVQREIKIILARLPDEVTKAINEELKNLKTSVEVRLVDVLPELVKKAIEKALKDLPVQTYPVPVEPVEPVYQEVGY